MYHVYVIQSKVNGRFYIGYTSDLEKRLAYHNSGKNKSTKLFKPWKLVMQETFATKKDAWLRERQLKKYKGGEAFKKLIG